MDILRMSEEEKNRILNKHKVATKTHYLKKEEDKQGLKQPKKKEDKKSS